MAAICLGISAQNELDALRYSTLGAGGSARTLGMAGSFSTIGADGSAAMINPAGLAVFRRGEFNFGFQFLNTANNSTYINETVKGTNLNFNIPTLNLILTNIRYDENGKPAKKGLVNINYGFNINRLASFNGRMAFDADNNKSSIADFFVEKCNANYDYFNSNSGSFELGSLPDLAYRAGAVWDSGGSIRPYYRGLNQNTRNNHQSGDVTSKGAIYEYQFTAGLNFSHKIQIGLGLFYSSLKYSEVMTLLEEDKSPKSTPDIASIDYQSKLYDKGNAVGARFGIIARPTDALRLGFSIQTPRTFKVNSEYGYSVQVKDDPGSANTPDAQFNDPLSTYTYKITTPTRLNLGVGFVIQKILILSADLEFYDYSQAVMSSADVTSWNKENSAIRKNYSNVINFRLGAEYNLPNPQNKDQAYRFRVGYANLPSPFSTRAAGLDEILKKANSIISTGFGLRDKDYYMDFSLSMNSSAGYYVPYTTAATSPFPHSSITNKQSRVAFSFTVGLNFD
jgi:hypothetical protein